MWVFQHHPVHAFDMNTILVFVYLGLQVKWNQLSSNNSHHTSCIHKRLHAGKWPDLMTSKPDSVSTLGYYWTDHTGRPLEQPQVHWDATGTVLADASTQWCPSGDPVVICIIGTHWWTTGKPLEYHWKHTGNTLATNNSPVAFLCTLGSKFQAHWIATGLPLEDHWLRVRAQLFSDIIDCPIMDRKTQLSRDIYIYIYIYEAMERILACSQLSQKHEKMRMRQVDTSALIASIWVTNLSFRLPNLVHI